MAPLLTLLKMSKDVFQGTPVNLSDMMMARENRSAKQLALLTTAAPGASLLCATMNIPGAIKNSPVLTEVFFSLLREVFRNLGEDVLVRKEILAKKTGSECFAVLNLDPVTLKEKMIAIESNHPYGRLFDLDVLFLKDGQVTGLSRTAIGFAPRRCLICEEDAKVCGRARRHSVLEMQGKIAEIINKGKN
ncbi:citrate lyase holo-[acyl-carrier protein] synthase [Enterococcus nangangensis]|uniref:citrate lyase holo-[acyl-carrier protein] synthase n=1 Tax=Enterococcus nangangensis TaxID=2559926 RepID=UPI0010F9D067|nr:citrate lyase holo-[acyl-carrier protein] synthase [Enterococcus nangangensis]